MVNKLTNTVKPLDEVDKINEIIDELNTTIGTPITFFKTDGTTLTLLQYISNTQ